ncbi:hypothetical protein JTE90_006668 [Oedothorax gibbosus]|uniref:Reticulon-like protein n=1 Tax=Oedothorax gibbosus TaxID=931172 RepID=A0AAV6V3M3_9ARAC|nr:hypothetical protein JTE90_006668 [Oedothorax gibbosus]
MEEIKDFYSKEADFPTEMSKNDSPLLDMESFETLESSINAASGFGGDLAPEKPKTVDDFEDFPAKLTSTTRPLVTSSEEDISPASNLLDYVNVGPDSSLIDIGADTRVEDSFRDPVPPESSQQRGDDQLLIGSEPFQGGPFSYTQQSAATVVESDSSDYSPVPTRKEPLPKSQDPKIVSEEREADFEKENYEAEVVRRAYEPAAQPVKPEVAMEAEKVGNGSENNAECECPFSPGAWFNPEKLHPELAKYVYWQDPKKSGIALGASLILLFSFKFCSVISVAAYLTLALLIVTVSFRIYKNVLQAVQKSNEGHPFKEYLEMDIALSQDKVGQTVETLISHVNCVSSKLRSLILVEDLVDTIKLGVLAWCMTYIGAWFNGLTLVILAVVSMFTLPKVYETNKAQIDTYADIVRTKGKEVIEMVNAKMPMGKKKKDQ